MFRKSIMKTVALTMGFWAFAAGIALSNPKNGTGVSPDDTQQKLKDCDACRDEKNCAETKKSEFVECVIDANAKTVAANLIQKSKILKHLVEAKKIRIVAAKYDLDDGIVTLFK